MIAFCYPPALLFTLELILGHLALLLPLLDDPLEILNHLFLMILRLEPWTAGNLLSMLSNSPVGRAIRPERRELLNLSLLPRLPRVILDPDALLALVPRGDRQGLGLCRDFEELWDRFADRYGDVFEGVEVARDGKVECRPRLALGRPVWRQLLLEQCDDKDGLLVDVDLRAQTGVSDSVPRTHLAQMLGHSRSSKSWCPFQRKRADHYE